MSVYNQPFAAKLAGTGALLSVNTGFQPKLILVLNITQLSITFWSEGMDQAKGLQVDDSGADTTNVIALASGGISASPQGFSLGTNSALNAASDVIHVVAF